MDRWHGMTMEDIRRLEDKTKQELDKVCMHMSEAQYLEHDERERERKVQWQ